MNFTSIISNDRLVLGLTSSQGEALRVETPAKGVRCYDSWIVGLFLRIFGYAETISVQGQSYCVNKKSLKRWAEECQTTLRSGVSILKSETGELSVVVTSQKASKIRKKEEKEPQKKSDKQSQLLPYGEQEVFISKEKIQTFLQVFFKVSSKQMQEAVQSLHLVQGSIVETEEGVIQDAAGVAVGGDPYTSGAAGLSGAIYKKFSNLKTLPQLAPGKSALNPGNARILHTHSPQLHSCKHVKEAVDTLSSAYYEAIKLFVTTEAIHKQKQLHLSAISAAIYGGRFASNSPIQGHIDPSLTLAAFCAAHARLKREGIDLKPYKVQLFYFGESVYKKAVEVKKTLEES